MGYPKLEDIARKAGVSKAVVSYVLSGKAKDYRISMKTCDKVRKIAEDLNYIPHSSASSFRRGGTNILGLIVQDISSPFYSELARGISDKAHQNGLQVIHGNSYGDPEREKELIHSLLEQRVQGIIILAINPSSSQHLNMVQELKVPLVLFEKLPPESPYLSATFDDFQGTYLATQYLLELGHREIAFCGTRCELEFIQIIEQSREQGYQQALADHHIHYQENLVFKFHDYHESLDKELKRFVRQKPFPTAVVCISDDLAALLMNVAQDAGIKIPEELSIIGNDDLFFCQYLRPRLSSVYFPRHQMGEVLTDMIVSQIKSKKLQPPATQRQKLIAPNLIIRDSCAPPRR